MVRFHLTMWHLAVPSSPSGAAAGFRCRAPLDSWHRGLEPCRNKVLSSFQRFGCTACRFKWLTWLTICFKCFNMFQPYLESNWRNCLRCLGLVKKQRMIPGVKLSLIFWDWWYRQGPNWSTVSTPVGRSQTRRVGLVTRNQWCAFGVARCRIKQWLLLFYLWL